MKWSISTSLAWLVFACILPGALLSAYFIVADYQQQKTRAIRDVIATARAAAATLDRDLASIESGLRVLATTPSLATDDLASFYQRAKAALPYQNISNYVLIDEQGRQQLNTLVPWGSPLPQVGGPPQLQRIFQADNPVLTDIFIGPVTGKPILAMSVPVKRDGSTVYSLSSGIFPERMADVLKAQHFPADWISVIIDSNGNIVARSRDMARYLGKPAVPELVRLARESREGVLETVTLEGVPVITAFSRSHLSGWSVAVGIPRSELTANLKPAMALLIITSTLVFAAALAIAWRLAMSRMIMPTNRLLQHMERIAHGDDPGSSISHQSSQEFAALEQGFADMSARLREREQEREALLGRLINTLESINDGFYLLDDQWRFAYVNHRAETLLKRDRQTLIGQDHWSVLATEDAVLLLSAFKRAVALHQTANLEARLPSLGLWLDIHAYPTEQGLAVYFQDVSELRSAQQANEAQRIAEAANQAKTEFLSRMSHELRTPLNAVLGFSQVLKMDTTEPLSPRHCRMVEHIESSGQHLLDMITDVLDVSRIEAGGMQITITDVEIRPLINDCQKMIVADANAAGLSLQAEAPNHGISVRADKTRLKQVLLNLLSNAVKYNQPGGRVILLAQQHDKLVRFCIEDTG
ncbi:MAG: histidine kinase dimerization/phospho-acceptor domain-containing protein, partial [Pseudomonadota bacterium]